jgi:2-dehydro-3-deoxygluconokinase
VVVAVGETMIRLSPPRGDLLAGAPRLDVTIGGSESNVLVALASLGVSTRWIGALSESTLGWRIADELSSCGVDVSRIVWRPSGRVGLYFVELPVRPRSGVVTYDRGDTAMTTFRPDELRESMLAGARYALVSGITAALKPHGAEVASRFLTLASKAGCTRVIDINYRAKLWAPDEARPALQDLAAQGDIVVCAAEDARTVFGLRGDDRELVAQVHTRLCSQASLVVLTMGSGGAVGRTSDQTIEVAALKPELVDPLGAGDAFVAGLIFAHSQGLNADECLRSANALAALACTVRGDHCRFDQAALTRALGGAETKAQR